MAKEAAKTEKKAPAAKKEAPKKGASQQPAAVKSGHPNYGACTVKCACGNTFTTGSTKPEIHVDICSSCHPFFTGKQKFLDTAGRIDKFNKKYNRAKKA